jgi:hypothetical protein
LYYVRYRYRALCDYLSIIYEIEVTIMADKKIYTVATSHLDTVWSWDFETTVSKDNNITSAFYISKEEKEEG